MFSSLPSSMPVLQERFRALPEPAALRARDEQLEALKYLVAHLAHGFNNSLMPVVGYIALLHDELKEPSPGKEFATKVAAAVERTAHLVDAIIGGTHPERHFVPGPVDLAALLEGESDTWLKALPSSAQVLVEADLSPCTLRLDETQWIAVIRQLLQNAARAMGGHGTLKLSLRPRTVTLQQAAGLGVNETNLFELEFKDDGCQMPPDAVPDVCDPFFTTRSRSPKTVLGWTMVHSVVRLHGGQIAIESGEESGTSVRIWLPTTAN